MTSHDDPSGALLADLAYLNGAKPPVQLPLHEATIELRLHGDGAEVRELVDAAASWLAMHPLVRGPVTTSVVER